MPVGTAIHNGDRFTISPTAVPLLTRLQTTRLRIVCEITAVAILLVTTCFSSSVARADSASYERVFEASFESKKFYADPFNDVDVDVVFANGGQSWRVPTFWRGGNRWTVRFAPPSPGVYTYRLKSTDPANPDLNEHEGRVTITAYSGPNELLRHGPLKVSGDRRYFEHGDGTPFYWLGDDWYTGLSDRLPWEAFQTLTANRKAKGFTVAELAFMTSSNEERAPTDPGFCNEGGCVWDEEFRHINPRYFDFSDRRVQHLVDAGIAPALFGAWHQVLAQMGVAKMRQHWRYIIARYGAYPVFWVLGGEINDPPPNVRTLRDWAPHANLVPGGWTEVARFIKATDPYHHPLTVHEGITAFPLQDSSLVDFDLIQPGHNGWPSIAMEVAELTTRYARAAKPIVVGEIGFEEAGASQLQDYQRMAFWLAMLNGAAGYTYGTLETASGYNPQKPLHRIQFSLFTWQEAMNFPGSRQVGLNADLLRKFPWQRFAPHPEWVMPRGTTLLDPQAAIPDPGLDMVGPLIFAAMNSLPLSETELPGGEWRKRHGDFRAPYAAGIPGKARIIYVPHSGLGPANPPTVLNLEPKVRYHAYLWDPSLGIKVDLGVVERPEPGPVIFREEDAPRDGSQTWTTQTIGSDESVWLANSVGEADLVATADVDSQIDISIILRYQDREHFVAATYSPGRHLLFLRTRSGNKESPPLGLIEVPALQGKVHLSAELRGNYGIVSLQVTANEETYTSPIVSLTSPDSTGSVRAGAAGVMTAGVHERTFSRFEVRASPTLVQDEHLERKLYDADGHYRGDLSGVPEWEAFGRTKLILLDAYRPETLPYPRDWVLVLDGQS
jgi:hypothetical protein